MADSDKAVTLDQVVRATTPQERADLGLLTRAEATAIQNAADQLRRDELGIPTYDRALLNTIPTSPTVIGYNPEKAADQTVEDASMMGAAGTALNAFMKEKVAAGVPASLALNLWQSGGTQGGGAQANFYKQIKALQDAGYSMKDSYQMVEHVAVAEPTESQLAAKEAILTKYKAAAVMPNSDKSGYVANPYFTSGFAESNTPEQLADVKSEIRKMETSGILATRVSNADKGTNIGLKGGSSGSSGENALSIFKTVMASGGDVTDSLRTKATIQSIAEKAAMASSEKELATPITETTTPAGTTITFTGSSSKPIITSSVVNPPLGSGKPIYGYMDKSSPEGVQVNNVFMYNDKKTVRDVNTGRMGYITDNGGISWLKNPYISNPTVVGSFGSQHDKRVPKKIQNTNSKYSSGFLGMITDLNRSASPKTTQQKPQQKKQIQKQPSEPKRYEGTWASLFLTDKKVTNTKKSVLTIAKPKTAPSQTKKQTKKQPEGSAWEQILFSKKPKEPVKQNKNNRGRK